MKSYSVEEIAELFELSVLTIRKWLRNGKLKGIKVGKEWRISDDYLRELFPVYLFKFTNSDRSTQVVDTNKIEQGKHLVDVYSNRKLFEELYSAFQQEKATDYNTELWDEFREKINRDIERRFPYPCINEDSSYYIHDGTPIDEQDRRAFYSAKYFEEIYKFNTLLRKIQGEYGVKEEDTAEIKRTCENIVLLTFGKEVIKN